MGTKEKQHIPTGLQEWIKSDYGELPNVNGDIIEKLRKALFCDFEFAMSAANTLPDEGFEIFKKTIAQTFSGQMDTLPLVKNQKRRSELCELTNNASQKHKIKAAKERKKKRIIEKEAGAKIENFDKTTKEYFYEGEKIVSQKQLLSLLINTSRLKKGKTTQMQELLRRDTIPYVITDKDDTKYYFLEEALKKLEQEGIIFSEGEIIS